MKTWVTPIVGTLIAAGNVVLDAMSAGVTTRTIVISAVIAGLSWLARYLHLSEPPAKTE